MSKIVIDPITRVSGLLGIEVEIKNNKIIDAKCKGNQFRGFEKMFEGRDPLDIIRLAPRICGICSTHHTLAATEAMEDAFKVIPDVNGKLAREIANGFEFLQNHLRQIYLFAIPDYVQIIDLNPITKNQGPREADYRLPGNLTMKINKDIEGAIEYSRLAHKAIAILAGKAPHCHGIYVGGITTDIGIQQIEELIYIINKIKAFINIKLLEDIYIIADYYKDYYSMGKGYGNFITGGVFEDYEAPIKYSIAGVMINGSIEKLDKEKISENIFSSWLENSTGEIKPGIDQPPIPSAYKNGAYSWVEAARYNGYALEGGPLARMIINGYYKRGVSVMDRLIARVLEAQKLCESIEAAINVLKIGKPYQQEWKIPEKGAGSAIIGAARGCLGHWINIDKKKVSNYTIIPPSAWNLSPTDGRGVRGPVEEALIGTTINNVTNPVEIGRIVRSFDPCLNCAAHVVSDRYEPFEVKIV
ncbi:MAG: nickel-dependent hydrogenase large subunit [Clostridium sp.]